MTRHLADDNDGRGAAPERRGRLAEERSSDGRKGLGAPGFGFPVGHLFQTGADDLGQPRDSPR